MVFETGGKRLFVPLATAPFEWFRSGGKRWELRRYGRQYTERTVVPGREVELRRGYQRQGDALWGTVAQTVKANSILEFFDRVPYELVIPIAKDRSEATQIAVSILGIVEDEDIELFGFSVEFK